MAKVSVIISFFVKKHRIHQRIDNENVFLLKYRPLSLMYIHSSSGLGLDLYIRLEP